MLKLFVLCLTLFVVILNSACSENDNIVGEQASSWSSTSGSIQSSLSSIENSADSSQVSALSSASSIQVTSSASSIAPATLEVTMDEILPRNVKNSITQGKSLKSSVLSQLTSGMIQDEISIIDGLTEYCLFPKVEINLSGSTFDEKLYSMYYTGNPFKNNKEYRDALFSHLGSKSRQRGKVFKSSISDDIMEVIQAGSFLGGVADTFFSIFGLGGPSVEEQTLAVANKTFNLLQEMNATMQTFQYEARQNFNQINNKLDDIIMNMATKEDFNVLYQLIAQGIDSIKQYISQSQLSSIRNEYESIMLAFKNAGSDADARAIAQNKMNDFYALILNFIDNALLVQAYVKEDYSTDVNYKALCEDFPSLNSGYTNLGLNIYWDMDNHQYGYCQTAAYLPYKNPRRSLKISHGNLDYLIKLISLQMKMYHTGMSKQNAENACANFASAVLAKLDSKGIRQNLIDSYQEMKSEYSARMNSFEVWSDGVGPQGGMASAWYRGANFFEAEEFYDEYDYRYTFMGVRNLCNWKTKADIILGPADRGTYAYLDDQSNKTILKSVLDDPYCIAMKEIVKNDYLQWFALSIGDVFAKYAAMEVVLKTYL